MRKSGSAYLTATFAIVKVEAKIAYSSIAKKIIK
jgi:hypothetical protein